ncbi:hypothetical protein BC834DRAFT_143915 [Gloeopeniophorella convolvens]|nr:hypothetical protein BC834DRAFT_143915 [Gloeopeniophorella convolvens]
MRKDGLQQSVARSVQDISVSAELHALKWLLETPTLSESHRFQNFLLNVPGPEVARLLQNADNPGTSFVSRLYDFLRTCLPGAPGRVEEDVRKLRLSACLDAIYRGAQIYGRNADFEDDGDRAVLMPEHVRHGLAGVDVMERLWEDEEPNVRIRARCICALLAKRVAQDIRGPEPRRSIGAAHLAWLSFVWNKTPHEVSIFLGDRPITDAVNLRSLLQGVRPQLQAWDSLSRDTIVVLVDTLATITKQQLSTEANTRLQALIARAHTRGCKLLSESQALQTLLDDLGHELPATMPTPTLAQDNLQPRRNATFPSVTLPQPHRTVTWYVADRGTEEPGPHYG